jgi:hypothetical protein
MDDEMIRRMAADLERAKKMVEPHLPSIEAAFTAYQQCLPSIQAAFTAYQQWERMSATGFARAVELAAEMAQWHKRLVESMALEREFLPKLAAHGWLISPLAPWDEPERLHALYQTGGIEAVEKDLVESIDSADCRAIVEDVKRSRPVFGKWAATFDKALEAQERGNHELAIPIWLAALDGACVEELGMIRAYSDIRSKSKRMRVTRLMENLSIVHEPLLRAWLDVLFGFSVESRDGGPALLNRHAVMHGKRPEVGSRKDALQCLLALQVIGYLLDVRDATPVR